MPIRAQVQYVEEPQVNLNFFTEPEFPIVPVNGTPQRQQETSIAPPEIIIVRSSHGTYINGTVSALYNDAQIFSATATSATTINTSIVVPQTTVIQWDTSSTTPLVHGFSSTTTSSTATYSNAFFNGHLWIVSSSGGRCSPEELARYERRTQQRKRQDHAKARGSIKRALKTMFNLGFEEEARIFLKGQTVEVSHPDSLFKFVIEKRPDSLISRTLSPGYSTPYQLSLYTKSDVYVAKLCVYMERTPILDQVMALAMFIKSGSEEQILKTANWFSKSQDQELFEILALEYPYLKSKLR